MSKGTVKFFNDSKGFGFIKDDASDKRMTRYLLTFKKVKKD